jgi:hypothetical protein
MKRVTWLVLCCLGCAAPSGMVDAGNQDAGVLDAGSDAGLDAGFDAGTACSAAPISGTTSCDECQAQHCCVTLSTCSANADCAPLWSCLLTCTTATCRNTCYQQYPNAVWAFSGLAICSRNTCATECSLAPASCGSITLTTTACDNCVSSQCCTERSTCGATDECDAFIYQCIDENQCADVTTSSCAERCRSQHDGGLDAFDTLRSCALAKCPTDCAGL